MPSSESSPASQASAVATGRTVQRLRWFAVDVGAIVVFVLLGRSEHHHGFSLGGEASTLWPFVLGVVVAWLLLWPGSSTGRSLAAGGTIAFVTVVNGQALRVLAGQGTDAAFCVVAFCFVTLFFSLTRAIARWWSHRG